MGDTFILKSEDLTRLAAGWYLEFDSTIEGGHLYLSAQSTLSKVDWQLVEDVIVIPGKELMLFNGQSYIEITRGAASGPRLPFTPESYLGFIVNPSRNCD